MRGMTETMTIGERVAFYRRRRGMAQVVLAGLVGRTEDWLSKVENNRIELDRLSVIRTPRGGARRRLGRPCRSSRRCSTGPSDSGVRTVPALRAVLMDYGQMAPALAVAPTGAPPDLDALQRAVGEVFDAYQASRYAYVAGRAPLVLADALPRLTDRRRRRPQPVPTPCLRSRTRSAVSVLTKLGETDLAWIAAERGLNAAQQTDNPVVTRLAVPVGRPRPALDGPVPGQRAAGAGGGERSGAAGRQPRRRRAAVGLRDAVPHRRRRGRPRRRPCLGHLASSTRPPTAPAGSAATRTRCGRPSARPTSRSTA